MTPIDFKQLTTVADILMLSPEQMDVLWKWANRTKHDRPSGLGINGMPLLSVGRCIEFLIDKGIPLKELMAALASDFHNTPDAELLDVLWDSVRLVLAKPQLKVVVKDGAMQLKVIVPSKLHSDGSMQQWMGKDQWKQLTQGEMARLWAWVNKTPSDIPRMFYNISDRPMLSIGRLLEFLTDHKMSLKEIFQQIALYENTEWVKMQLIDVLWDDVKKVLRLPVPIHRSVVDVELVFDLHQEGKGV